MNARSHSMALLVVAAAVVLASCDRPKGAPENFPSPTDPPAAAQASPPAPAVHRARLERVPEPIVFDAASGTYTLDGRFLPIAHLWRFKSLAEEFSGAGTALKSAPDGGLEVSMTLPDGIIRSPQSLAIDGARYNAVLVRLTRLKDSNKWDGSLFYTTDRHPESAAYFARPIRGADPAPGETTLMVYDMRQLRKGGNDWVTSKIRGLRLDLDDTPGGVFHVQEIAVVALPEAAP